MGYRVSLADERARGGADTSPIRVDRSRLERPCVERVRGM